MRFNFRGKSFSVVFKKLKNEWGTCQSATPRIIEISSGIRKKKLLLDTMIHEICHACFPDISEDAVDEAARDMAEFLWQMGYRKEEFVKNNKKKIIRHKKRKFRR